MGLSERKSKQRIGNDPRNLAWANDTSSFGHTYLAKAGHVANTALGLNSNGLVNPIAVARKMDNGGIGVGRARREGETESNSSSQANGLEALLRRLASASASPSPGPSSPAETETAEQPVASSSKTPMMGFSRATTTDIVAAPSTVEVVAEKKPHRLAHRAKFLKSKKLATLSSNPSAMSEILGLSSPSPSPAPSPAPSNPTQGALTSLASDQDQLITSSTLSVSDYFKLRMEEKKKAMLERIAAASAGGSAASTPTETQPEVTIEEEISIVQPIPVSSQTPSALVSTTTTTTTTTTSSTESASPSVLSHEKKEPKRRADGTIEGRGGKKDKKALKAAKKLKEKEEKEAEKAKKEAERLESVGKADYTNVAPPPAKDKKRKRDEVEEKADTEEKGDAKESKEEKKKRKEEKKAKKAKKESSD